jgi:threonine/homoserine/homoserine lactone efflux protein
VVLRPAARPLADPSEHASIPSLPSGAEVLVMPDLANYLLFLAASTALILVPGPAQALVLARTLAAGPRAGALTAVGLNVGTLCHSLAAALGLSAVLATSALAFAVVKYAGAAYLLWLGIRALGTRERPAGGAPPAPASARATFGQAVATGILNPKIALFFLAFLPQFVDPARGSSLAQFLLLGGSMALLDTLYELALVRAIHGMRERYLRSERMRAWQSRVSGAVLLGLGLRLAVQER